MSHTALIAFAPVASKDVFLNPDKVRSGRKMYSRGAFKFKPGGVPVVVDHDRNREVGVVREFSVIDDIDGEWHSALATITDPPEWLKRGTGASFKFIPFMTNSHYGFDHVSSAMVLEVTVCSPAHEPKDPAAKVLTIGPTEAPPKAAPAVRRDTPARFTAGTVATPGIRHLRRGETRPASDRYLSSLELETLIEVAKTADVEMLARLMLESGELNMPDPSICGSNAAPRSGESSAPPHSSTHRNAGQHRRKP